LGWGRDLHGKTHRQRVAGVWRSSALRQGGLCEYDQHLSIFDFLCVSVSLENRVIEYVDHLHEHFVNPVSIVSCDYVLPQKPGYSIQVRPETLEQFVYPTAKYGETCRETLFICV